ncbi:hypothetical protein L2E82_35085 [Cichorium intybus]|uniref:Uncharacterized protein n=1 Tax=Cichorium intybus TaxID=13427 RepID=A0ACB9BNA9_CICIN|nr:hypothetical protein L2E82_35085 [Cichorium intybus]
MSKKQRSQRRRETTNLRTKHQNHNRMKPFQQKLGSIAYLPSSRGRQLEETTTTRKKTTEKMTTTVEDEFCRVVAARRDCRSNEAIIQKKRGEEDLLSGPTPTAGGVVGRVAAGDVIF